jgi:hypothetical protein
VTVIPASEWFDLWHAHPNIDATDQRWSNLLSVWMEVDAAGRKCGRPWQSWILVDLDNPLEDSVYLHTPNPNRDNFPYPFDEVTWGAEPPCWAATDVGLEFGLSDYGGAKLLWVRRRPRTESADWLRSRPEGTTDQSPGSAAPRRATLGP